MALSAALRVLAAVAALLPSAAPGAQRGSLPVAQVISAQRQYAPYDRSFLPANMVLMRNMLLGIYRACGNDNPDRCTCGGTDAIRPAFARRGETISGRQAEVGENMRYCKPRSCTCSDGTRHAVTHPRYRGGFDADVDALDVKEITEFFYAKYSCGGRINGDGTDAIRQCDCSRDQAPGKSLKPPFVKQNPSNPTAPHYPTFKQFFLCFPKTCTCKDGRRVPIVD